MESSHCDIVLTYDRPPGRREHKGNPPGGGLLSVQILPLLIQIHANFRLCRACVESMRCESTFLYVAGNFVDEVVVTRQKTQDMYENLVAIGWVFWYVFA